MKSLHFPLKVADIVQRLKEHQKSTVDINSNTIRFKRTVMDYDVFGDNSDSDSDSGLVGKEDNDEIMKMS